MTDWNRIEADRREVADREYEGYDFSPYEVETTSGWSHETGAGETEWTRPVFLLDPEKPGADSVRSDFVVRFADASDTLTDVYATVGGEVIGKREQPATPAP